MKDEFEAMQASPTEARGFCCAPIGETKGVDYLLFRSGHLHICYKGGDWAAPARGVGGTPSVWGQLHSFVLVSSSVTSL